MKQQSFPPHGEGSAATHDGSSLLSSLRQFTHSAHVRLNQHPMLAGLTKSGYPLSKYRHLLAVYFHIYAVIEQQIDAFLARSDCAFDYESRRKLPWLIADLGYFGIEPESSGFCPARPALLKAPVDVGGLVGLLYAIEGATLGGQIISAHLRDTLALTADKGACFFNGYGDTLETQRHWQEFGEFANSLGNDLVQRQSAEMAAIAVFELIENQLDDAHAQLQH